MYYYLLSCVLSKFWYGVRVICNHFYEASFTRNFTTSLNVGLIISIIIEREKHLISISGI